MVMTADDLKKMEVEGMFAQGYSLLAFDADSGKFEKVTGVLVSEDGLRVELQTDSDECDSEQCDCEAATESKAEGGATAREYGVFGHVCLCLHHRADHANYTDGCNNCSCAKFIHYHSAESPQPSVQPHDHAKDDRKLPIDRPCSACSAGDSEMEYHSHCPPFRVEPSVQGEQNWAIIAAKEIADLWNLSHYGEHKTAEIIRKNAPAAPSITSARITTAAKAFVEKLHAIHADEKYQSVWTISQIHVGPYQGPNYIKELEELEKALREAGVRVEQ